MVYNIQIRITVYDADIVKVISAIRQGINPICPNIFLTVQPWWEGAQDEGSRVRVAIRGTETGADLITTYYDVVERVVDALLIGGENLHPVMQESWYRTDEFHNGSMEGGFDPYPWRYVNGKVQRPSTVRP